MRRTVVVATFATAVFGLTFNGWPVPAATAHVGAVVFVGLATVSPGLVLPQPNQGVDGWWTMANTGGLPNVGVGATTDGGLGAATVAAAGVLHGGLVHVFGPGGFCGMSGGSDGEGSIDVSGSLSAIDVRDVGWLQSAATVIVFAGDTTYLDGSTTRVGGSLAGVVSAVPTKPLVGSDSCLSGGAREFLVVGAAAATFTT